MAAFDMPSFELFQIKAQGYTLSENVHKISAYVKQSEAQCCLFSANALLPIDVSKNIWKESLQDEIMAAFGELLVSGMFQHELFVVTNHYENGVFTPAILQVGNMQFDVHTLQDIADHYVYAARFPIVSTTKPTVQIAAFVFNDLKTKQLDNLQELILNHLQRFNLEYQFIVVFGAVQWKANLRVALTKSLQDIARACQKPLCFVNGVGTFENQVFYGGSFSVSAFGELTNFCPCFVESSALVNFSPAIKVDPQGQVNYAKNVLYTILDHDLPKNFNQANKRQDYDLIFPRSEVLEFEELWQALVFGLKTYLTKVGDPQVFVGVSGGLDSALVLAIAQASTKANNVHAVFMPSPYTSKASRIDALALCQNLKLEPITIAIDALFDNFKTNLDGLLNTFEPRQDDVTFENLQARLRGTILMTLANRAGGIVLNTSNKSEIAMGYSTLYGDTIGAIAVIGDLLKTQVYGLAKWYNSVFQNAPIPESIITKAPSAELKFNQKDSDTLPSYDILDATLNNLFLGKSPTTAEDEEIYQRFIHAEFKRRQEPPCLIVSEYVLGQDIFVEFNDALPLTRKREL